jgi:hypothetical protein
MTAWIAWSVFTITGLLNLHRGIAMRSREAGREIDKDDENRPASVINVGR